MHKAGGRFLRSSAAFCISMRREEMFHIVKIACFRKKKLTFRPNQEEKRIYIPKNVAFFSQTATKDKREKIDQAIFMC